jgi:hypothetical protein
MNAPPAYCHRCGRKTPTVYLCLAGGLIGNCCAVCRACRKGRPYVSRRDFSRCHDAREGQRVGHEHRGK